MCTDADVGFLIEVIKKQVTDVTAIVASSRVTESARLELGKGTNGEDATFSDVVPVHIVKHATFNLALCRKLLEAVCPESSGDRGAGGGGSSTQSSVRMASLLDSNDPLIIRVAGGLLHYLVRNKIVNEMEHGDAPIVLHGGLRMFNISDMMMIDTLSFTGECARMSRRRVALASKAARSALLSIFAHKHGVMLTRESCYPSNNRLVSGSYMTHSCVAIMC